MLGTKQPRKNKRTLNLSLQLLPSMTHNRDKVIQAFWSWCNLIPSNLGFMPETAFSFQVEISGEQGIFRHCTICLILCADLSTHVQGITILRDFILPWTKESEKCQFDDILNESTLGRCAQKVTWMKNFSNSSDKDSFLSLVERKFLLHTHAKKKEAHHTTHTHIHMCMQKHSSVKYVTFGV